MFNHKLKSKSGIFAKRLSASFLILTTITGINVFGNKPYLASTGIDFIWDSSTNFVKLKYLQSSNEKNDRSTYYLFLRGRDRKSDMLSISIKVPEYFDTEIKPEKLVFCKVKVGGYTSRTKCIKEIPSLIEVNNKQTSIDIYPETVIPASRDTYALKMKIINPRKSGMFQFHAYAQRPQDVPIPGYVGSWNMDVR